MKNVMVSMRMPEDMVQAGKKIAEKLNIGYQVYFRQELSKIISRDKKKYG